MRRAVTNLSILCLVALVGCVSGPERTARGFLSAIRDGDQDKVIGLVSNGTISSVQDYFDLISTNDEVFITIANALLHDSISLEEFQSWSSESILVTCLRASDLSKLASAEALILEVVQLEDSATVLMSDGHLQDTLTVILEDGKWRIQLDIEQFAFGPLQTISAFDLLLQSADPQIAADLISPDYYDAILDNWRVLKSCQTASVFLAEHGIQTTQEQLVTWSPQDYIGQYLRAHSDNDEILSAEDESPRIQIEDSTATISSESDGSTRSADLVLSDALWLIQPKSQGLPLPPRIDDQTNSDMSLWESSDDLYPEFVADEYLVASTHSMQWRNNSVIYGLDPLTGSREWSAGGDSHPYYWAYEGLTVAGGSSKMSQVYLDCVRGLACISATTGAALWSFIPGAEGLPESEIGVCGNPTGPRVYVECTTKPQNYLDGHQLSRVCCLDSDNGELLWTFDLSFGEMDANQDRNAFYMEHVSSSFVEDDQRVVFFTTGGNIYCLDLESGELVWRNYTSGIPCGHPIICDDQLYLGGGSSNGYGNAFINGAPGDPDIYCLRMTDGVREWRYLESYSVSSIELGSYGDQVVVWPSGGEHLLSFSAADGQCLWSFPDQNTAQEQGLTAVFDTMLVFAATSTCVYALDPSDGSTVWCDSLPETFLLSVSEDKLLGVRWNPDQGFDAVMPLICIDKSDGSVLWEASGLSGGGLVLGNGVVYSHAGNRLYCYTLEADGSIPLSIWE